MERFGGMGIDPMGRVVIPRQLRETLGWNYDDKLSMYLVDNNTILVQRRDFLPEVKSSTIMQADQEMTVTIRDVSQEAMNE